MKIIKAKITKDNTLIATYVNENGDTVIIEGKNIVHKDLTASFCALIPHLAFLCEQKEADGRSILLTCPMRCLRRWKSLGIRSEAVMITKALR